jgi:hypothetical protein
MTDFVLVKGTLIDSEGHILANLRHEQGICMEKIGYRESLCKCCAIQKHY